MILNEDFFDDESVIQDIDFDNYDDESDEANNNPEYKFQMSILFVGVSKKYRVDAKSFADLLRQFQIRLNAIMNISILIRNYTNFVFSLEDELYNNNNHTVYGRTYNQFFKNINKDEKTHPETFEQFGVTVYNDKAVWQNINNLLSNASNFTINFSFNIYDNINYSRFINDFLFILSGIQKINTFIDKNIHISTLKITSNKNKTKPHFQCADKIITDIKNKLNSNSIKNYLKRLYNLLLDIDSYESSKYIKDYLSKNEYSNDALRLVKSLNVNDPNTLYIDEDDKSIRITIPKGVSAIIQNFKNLYKLIKNIEKNKYVFIYVEGKLTINITSTESIITTNYQNSFFYRNLGYLVNELVICFKSYDSKCNEIDLGVLQIQDLKVRYSPLLEWTYNYNLKYNIYMDNIFPIVTLNQTYIPKKITVYNNFIKQCPEAKDLMNGRIWWQNK